MKWRRLPVTFVVLVPACSLMAPDENFFDGVGGRGGPNGSSAAGVGGTSGGAASEPSAGTGMLSGGGITGGSKAGAGAGGEGGEGGSDRPDTPGGEAGVSSAGGPGGAESAGAAGTGGAAGCSLAPSVVQSEACGACSSGTRTRLLTVTDACSYASGPWSACQGEVAGACTPNQTETVTQACGACATGKQTRTRTCSANTCTWGAWSAWTTCSGVTAACTPGQTSACANGDSCGQRVCSSTCGWGACAPKVAGGCLRIRAGHTDEGSNYRCCGTGRWQFCLSSCQWSATCAACSEGAPSYCTECYP